MKRPMQPQQDPDKIHRSLIKLGLTQDDMLLLEREIEPVEGSPFELGWPHYHVLVEIREDAERFWYREKVRNQALTVRELEQAIRGNLFYKILGRRPPKPPDLGPRQPAPKLPSKKEWDKDPAYQKLLNDLDTIIREAEAKGVSLRHRRDDILSCASCSAFEDVICGEEERRTFLASGEETDMPFMVMDTKETTSYRQRGTRHRTRYRYICGVCGAHQSASFVSVFYDEEDEI